MAINVLFVCLGNICRSPTAHGLFEHIVKEAGLSDKIIVDSAGTGGWHAGDPPDARAQATAVQRGYNISHLKARQVNQMDYHRFDYILAMDEQNLQDLTEFKPTDFQGVLGLFLTVAGVEGTREVPDPYYGGDAHFNHVIDLIEHACLELLERIKKEHPL